MFHVAPLIIFSPEIDTDVSLDEFPFFSILGHAKFGNVALTVWSENET